MKQTKNTKQKGTKDTKTNKKQKKILIKSPQKKAIKNPSALKNGSTQLTIKKMFENQKNNITQTSKSTPKKLLEKVSNKVLEKKKDKDDKSLTKLGADTIPKPEKIEKKKIQKVNQPQVPYNCKYCDFQTPYLSSYKIHTDIHEGVKYECKACLHEAASKGALLAHMRRSSLCKPHLDPKKREKKSRAPPKIYRCGICSYEAQTKKCLQDHLIIHLPKDKLPQFKCNFCSFIGIRKNNLMRHKRLLHAADLGVKMETLYCYHCDYTTIYKTNLIDHIKRHFRERKIYACKYCDLTFVYKMAYIQHEATHKTEGMKYECPERSCKYWVPKKYMLKKHMIKHQSEHQVRMYQCPNCSHRTKYRASFKKHLERMCKISWEQWKEEHDTKRTKKNKTNKRGKKTSQNDKSETIVKVDSAHASEESETEWEFSLSDQEV